VRAGPGARHAAPAGNPLLYRVESALHDERLLNRLHAGCSSSLVLAAYCGAALCACEDGIAQCALHVPTLPQCYFAQIVTVSHSCSILQAVCVDGGMYLGARAYLEIGSDGHFRAFEKYRGSPNSAQYNTFHPTDLTEITCKRQV
jgi:hypothetical protein